jgi:hypothetical protein
MPKVIFKIQNNKLRLTLGAGTRILGSHRSPQDPNVLSLANVHAPEDVPRAVVDAASLEMVRVNCFCSREFPRHMSCFVDVARDQAPFVARALDGEAIEPTRVTFVLSLPESFRCARREQGCLSNTGRCLCRQAHSRANPRIRHD